MKNGKKWLAALMAMLLALGAVSALAEGGDMMEDKTMCGEDCACMNGESCMKDGTCKE